YHKKYYKQEPDFILKTVSGIRAVVECKYKPRYKNMDPNIEDSRQLAGYSRLNSIYDELDFDRNQLIATYVIYPSNLPEVDTGEKKNQIELDEFSDVGNSGSVLQGLLSNGKCRLSRKYNLLYMEEIDLPIAK